MPISTCRCAPCSGQDRGGEGRFEDAARFLETLFMHGVLTKPT